MTGYKGHDSEKNLEDRKRINKMFRLAREKKNKEKEK